MLLNYLLQGAKYIEFDHSFTDDEKYQAQTLWLSCQLNNAACKLKMDEFLQASKLCTKVGLNEKVEELENEPNLSIMNPNTKLFCSFFFPVKSQKVSLDYNLPIPNSLPFLWLLSIPYLNKREPKS